DGRNRPLDFSTKFGTTSAPNRRGGVRIFQRRERRAGSPGLARFQRIPTEEPGFPEASSRGSRSASPRSFSAFLALDTFFILRHGRGSRSARASRRAQPASPVTSAVRS